MSNTPFENIDGQRGWTHKEGDEYHVTGKDRAGKPVKVVTSSWQHAAGINVWQGTRWLVRDGKRHVIQRITN